MSTPQFDLYVKADSSGQAVGDCPFSLRALMYAHLKVQQRADIVKVIPVDLQNKPPEFLKLNPAGTTPVLVDQENGEIIADSGMITKHLNDTFPTVNTHHGYDGPGIQASSGIFGKLVALLKNSDSSTSAQLKMELSEELQKLEMFLSSRDHKGKYMLGDELSELDCSMLPKLKHLLVAGSYYRNYSIPSNMVNIQQYLQEAMASAVFKAVCPPDAEFVHGWKRHGISTNSE